MVLICYGMYGYLVWVIWADIVQSAIYGEAVGMSFSVVVSLEAMQNTFF